MGLNDIMLELSKQLANIVKPMVYNKIQVAQQQAKAKDNSTVAASQENIVSGNTSATQPGANSSTTELAIR